MKPQVQRALDAHLNVMPDERLDPVYLTFAGVGLVAGIVGVAMLLSGSRSETGEGSRTDEVTRWIWNIQYSDAKRDAELVRAPGQPPVVVYNGIDGKPRRET